VECKRTDAALLNTHITDIPLLSETHVTERTYIKNANWITYDTRHPDGTANENLAIIIRKDIKHYELAK
jgi:hypothetical protein